MTIKPYFSLQLTMLNRQLAGFGLNPLLSFFVLLLAFYGLSIYVYTQNEFANYLYIIFATSIVLKYSESSRNDFLKFTYSKKDYRIIRILENIITTIPFILFLCYKTDYLSVFILLMTSMILSFTNTNKINFTKLPTPFYKKPFEFTVGFRKHILLFLFAYLITSASIYYQNFNLGLFSLLLTFLVCIAFYSEPENEYYVWVHQSKAREFLIDKIKIAIVYSTLISLPITLALLLFFQSNIAIVLGVQALGYCYLSTAVLAKYTAYPSKISLPQGILFALSFTMPPLLLVLIPYFYIQSKNRLKEILE
ncbi:MAG: ABC transporter permease [Bacteroidetes bacterium]|nr:ABC transporter permease [Bacteroidota bacterium]